MKNISLIYPNRIDYFHLIESFFWRAPNVLLYTVLLHYTIEFIVIVLLYLCTQAISDKRRGEYEYWILMSWLANVDSPWNGQILVLTARNEDGCDVLKSFVGETLQFEKIWHPGLHTGLHWLHWVHWVTLVIQLVIWPWEKWCKKKESGAI